MRVPGPGGEKKRRMDNAMRKEDFPDMDEMTIQTHTLMEILKMAETCGRVGANALGCLEVRSRRGQPLVESHLVDPKSPQIGRAHV